MAFAHYNGPTCQSACHQPKNDAGTLSRSASPTPGPLDQLVSGTIDLLSWTHDIQTLSTAVVLEDAKMGVDLFFALGDPIAMAKAYDESIGKVSGLRSDFRRKHQTGINLNALAQWFAGIDAMKGKLFEYYTAGSGADRKLTYDEIKSMPTVFDLFETNIYSPRLFIPICSAARGQSVAVNAEVMGRNDALGNFTIHVVGVIKPATGTPQGDSGKDPYAKARDPADPGAELVFEGTMDWKDYWNFDTKWAALVEKKLAGVRDDRGWKSNLAVQAVATLVEGVPFDVRSDPVKVVQYSGRWPVY